MVARRSAARRARRAQAPSRVVWSFPRPFVVEPPPPVRLSSTSGDLVPDGGGRSGSGRGYLTGVGDLRLGCAPGLRSTVPPPHYTTARERRRQREVRRAGALAVLACAVLLTGHSLGVDASAWWDGAVLAAQEVRAISR